MNRNMSKSEETLSLVLGEKGIDHRREYRFAAEHVGMGSGIRQRLADAGLKDWRADFRIVGVPLLVEVEGITHYGRNRNGTMKLGRHQTGAGIEGDLAKYDAAMRLGYTVYRCSQHMVKSGRAIESIEILKRRLIHT